MKIVAISDLHGQFPKIPNKRFDILCICGDIFPLEIQDNTLECKAWLLKVFIPWCQKLKCNNILLIAGNHDLFFEKSTYEEKKYMFLGTNIHYLENDSYEIDGLTFYGTPYCHKFNDWAFMRSDDHLKIIYDLIPKNVDILLTHDAPYGTSDICLQEIWWNEREHIGCVPLRDAILEKKPKIVLHGHLHSTNHDVELMGDTKVYNVSVLDESYDLEYPPLILNL